MAEDGFLSRWSRRKAQVARGEQPAEPAEKPAAPSITKNPVRAELVEAPQPDRAAGPSTGSGRTENVPAAPAEPPPTLEDVSRLDAESDFSRFVARDVAPDVKNAALRKLFAAPHFNVMDGLDIYIDDYNKADPLPPGMLRQLAQSKLLGLFDEEEEPGQNADPDTPAGPAAPAAASDAPAAQAEPADDPAALPPTQTSSASDEDPDLQLQPHHAAGRRGPGEGPAAG